MTNKYENAKIVCIGLTANHRAPNDPNINKPVPQYNEIIEEVAGKYGALYVDQASVINSSNFQSYMHDTSVLHPNAAGHELIFREIVKALYEDLQK